MPGRAGMRPVIVYLHGRGAEPKHYCERWSHVARNLGWLVCPSGPEDRGDGKRGWNNSWPMGRNVVMAAIEGLRANATAVACSSTATRSSASAKARSSR